jgi:hypothetical protein
MSNKQYQQEYLGLFVEDLARFFSDELLASCCINKRAGTRPGNYYLGVDVGHLGGDESTFEIINKVNKDSFVHVENQVTSKTRTTDTIQRILDLDLIYKFKQIYIDDGGVGVGVFDSLLVHDRTKRKVVAINNARRSLDRNENQKAKLMKEDLYNNLLVLMEQGKIVLLDDDEVILSLKSIQYEYVIKEGVPTRFRIFGSYTHIAEGIIRAAWCNKDKHLNIWVNRSMIG